MDTKANTALIGTFTLVVLALAFVFIYWLARGGEETNNLPLIVVFNDPVTGLATGSQVVFNGIKVGEVKRLSLDPERPSTVVAELSVQTATPIKNDTNVVLGFQGLTGVGYVEMSGGSPTQPDIWQAESPAVLIASRSSMQDLMAGARNILARADETLKTIEATVKASSGEVTEAITNVRTFTGALAANADGIENLMTEASRAAAAIAEITPKLQGIATRGEALVSAVEPEQVRATVANVNRVVADLAERTDEISGIIDRVSAISTSAETFAAGLPALRDRTDALLAAVDPAAVGRTLTRIDEITAAVEPERIRTTVNALADVSETIGANRENIDRIVTRLSAISSDVSAFSVALPELGTKVNSLLAAVDPAKVGSTIDNAEKFASALGENSDDVDVFMANARAASEQFKSISERADALLAKFDGLAGGGTGDLISEARATMAAIRAAAESIDEQTVSIGEGIGRFSNSGLKNIEALVGQGQRTIGRLDRVITDLEQNPSGLIFGGEKVPEFSGGGGNRR